MSDLKEKLLVYGRHCARGAREARRFLTLARLTPTPPLLLLLAPTLGALALAAGGLPHPALFFGVLLLTLSLWGAAWCYLDLLGAERGGSSTSVILQGITSRKEALYLLAALCVVALTMLLLLEHRVLLLAPLMILVAVSYPWLRKRSFLIDVWFGLGIAWSVPLVFAASGRWPGKGGALLAVITLLWVAGWSVLRNWPRQLAMLERGVRTLGHMFGGATGYLVIAFQVMVLFGAWMAGGQEKFGWPYQIALLLAAAAVVWQSLLLYRKGVAATAQALHLHLFSGAVLWAGVLLHALAA